MASTIQLPASSSLPEPIRPHWLPMKAGDSCTVDDADRFFEPHQSKGCTGSEGTSLTASIRGRQLQGASVSLPAGYVGVLVRREQESSSSDAAQWQARAAFHNVTYWNHDTLPSRSDHCRRALDWLEIAMQVHAPVLPEAVEAQLLKMSS